MSGKDQYVGGAKALFGARGFYQQYIAVMLIVLAFTIGAFLRGGPVAQNPGQQPPAPPAPQPYELSRIPYAELFSEGQADMDSAKIEALADFLRSHDVKAEFELYARPGDAAAPGGAVALALARAVTLATYFEKAQIPAEAVAVYTVEAQRDVQAQVRLLKLRGAHG